MTVTDSWDFILIIGLKQCLHLLQRVVQALSEGCNGSREDAGGSAAAVL